MPIGKPEFPSTIRISFILLGIEEIEFLFLDVFESFSNCQARAWVKVDLSAKTEVIEHPLNKSLHVPSDRDIVLYE